MMMVARSLSQFKNFSDQQKNNLKLFPLSEKALLLLKLKELIFFGFSLFYLTEIFYCEQILGGNFIRWTNYFLYLIEYHLMQGSLQLFI